eukprot:TRINITY_DN74657_c0_g1_i1.p2 TRINITY_DN74657_c0_g1~~TRINITY_DN74657_c0_g1_i1.p2  ORF type:complete len:160 (-),score=11.50 TRINITY_DN74657_c0_g1_i1:195-674(-)
MFGANTKSREFQRNFERGIVRENSQQLKQYRVRAEAAENKAIMLDCDNKELKRLCGELKAVNARIQGVILFSDINKQIAQKRRHEEMETAKTNGKSTGGEISIVKLNDGGKKLEEKEREVKSEGKAMAQKWTLLGGSLSKGKGDAGAQDQRFKTIGGTQ